MIRTIAPTVLAVLILSACGGARGVAEGPRPEGDAARGGAVVKDQRAQEMAMFMDATRARLTGDLPKAVQLFEACLRLDPKNAAAMYELSKLYNARQDATGALDMARKAQQTDRENLWYRLLLADLCMQGQRFDEAASVYRGILDKWPDHFEVYFDLAGALARDGKVEEARRVYADMRQRLGPSDELTMNEFDMLAGAGQLQEARILLEKALEAEPDKTEFRSMLAGLYDELGEHEKALAEYEYLLRLDPDDNMTRIALAEHYYGTGDTDKAFEHLHVAFADPDLDVDAKMQLLLGFFEMTHPGADTSNGAGRRQLLDRSYELIHTLKQAHPQSGKPFAIEGDFLLRDNKLAEARDAFREAARYEKDKYPIWQQLVDLDLRLSDYPGLQQDASAAAELFPTIPLFHLYNGIALSNLGRHDEAIEALVTGRDLVVDDTELLAQFWTSLGDAYNEAGRSDESDKAFDKALELDPDNATTLNNHAYYLSLRHTQLEKAERMSRRSNELAPGQSSFQDTYAWVLFQLGRYSDAREWIEKAVQSGGAASGEVLEHYGDILYRAGDAEGALLKWKEAQRLGGASDAIGRKVAEGRLPD